MKKKRYLVAILLLLVVPVVLGNISWANDSDNAYSIDQAIAKALDSENPAIKELEWKEDDAHDSLSSARSSLSSVNKAVYPEEWYKAYAAVQIAEVNNDSARRAKDLSTTQITLQVKQAYFDALLAQENADLARKKINQAGEVFTIAKARYDRGLSSKKEFLNAQVSLASSETSLAEAERQKELAYLSLKKLMNISFDENIVLTSKLTYEPMKDINPSTAAGGAAEASSSYIQAEDMVEAYEDIKEQPSSSGANLTATNTYDNAEIQVKKYKNQMEIIRTDVKLAYYKAYVNLKRAEDKLKTINKQIELAEEVAKVAKLSYRAGTGTLGEADDALLKLEELKLQYQQALHAYNTAKASFEANIF